MEKELLNKYKIRDYYMIPTEIVDNVFYEFETQLKKQKEIIDKIKSAIKTNCIKIDEKYIDVCCSGDYLLQILEDKEV